MSWSKKAQGIALNDAQIAFLNELSKELNFDILVTSGIRSASSQVDAMFKKIEKGEDLTKLYRDTKQAQDIQDLYPDRQEAIETIKYYVKIGRPISRHLSGLAFDLRSWSLSKYEMQLLEEQVRKMNGGFLLESDHIHIEIPEPKKKNRVVWMMLGIAVFWVMR